MVGIYTITSPSNKVYIGQSFDIRLRLLQHFRPSVVKKLKTKLAKSIRAHGASAHKFETVYVLPDDVNTDVLTAYEQFFIDQYTEAGIPLLNICPAAGSTKGINFKLGPKTEEHKQKLRVANLGKKQSIEAREKMSKSRKGRPGWNKGLTHTEEHKAKISAAGKGRKMSEKAREALRLSNIGRKHTEETKAILREKGRLQKHYPCSEEQKKAISNANKGAYRSPEMRERISNSLKGNIPWNKGRPNSEETINKIKEALKKRRDGI